MIFRNKHKLFEVYRISLKIKLAGKGINFRKITEKAQTVPKETCFNPSLQKRRIEEISNSNLSCNAGLAGLEPATNGFGDHYSTN